MHGHFPAHTLIRTLPAPAREAFFWQIKTRFDRSSYIVNSTEANYLENSADSREE